MKTQRLSILVIIITLLALTACTGAEAAPAEVESPPIKVGWAIWPGYYPLVIGVEKGFFAEQGLTVEPILQEGAGSSDLLAGKLDALLGTMGDAVELGGKQGGPVRLVLPVDYSDGGDVFLASADIKSPSDLKGQTIGVIDAPFSPVFATAMLEAHNISPQAANYTNYRISDALSLLENGQAQAVHVYEPYLSQGLEQGYQVIYSSQDAPGVIVDVLMFREAVAQERPEDVQAFVTAWLKTVEWWQANPAEGNAIMAEATDLPIEQISLEGVALLDREGALSLFEQNSESASLHDTAQLYSDTLINLGISAAAPDFDKLIDPSFIK